MKKLTALISALALMFLLCACSGEAGGTPSESVSQTPAASQAVSDGPIQNTEDPVETPADPKAIAIELSERRAPVSELYAAIGQPISIGEYVPSCLGEGEDGELH